MSYATIARPIGPSRPTIQRAPASQCGIAPHRGDVTTVEAASYVRLQQTKRIEKLQAHAPSHRTPDRAPVPVLIQRTGWASIGQADPWVQERMDRLTGGAPR